MSCVEKINLGEIFLKKDVKRNVIDATPDMHRIEVERRRGVNSSVSRGEDIGGSVPGF